MIVEAVERYMRSTGDVTDVVGTERVTMDAVVLVEAQSQGGLNKVIGLYIGTSAIAGTRRQCL